MKKNLFLAAVLFPAVLFMSSCSGGEMQEPEIHSGQSAGTRAMADFPLWIASTSQSHVHLRWTNPGDETNVNCGYQVMRKINDNLSYEFIAWVDSWYTEEYVDTRISTGYAYTYKLIRSQRTWDPGLGCYVYSSSAESTTAYYNNGWTPPGSGDPIIKPPFVDPGGKVIMEP